MSKRFLFPTIGSVVFSLTLIVMIIISPYAFAANSHSLDLERSSGTYAEISNLSQVGLGITGNLTIEAWVKIESQPTSGELQCIASKFHGGNMQRSYWLCYIDDSGTTKFLFSISDASSTTDHKYFTYTLPTDEWHHVAAVYTATSSTYDLYVDGTSLGAQTGSLTTIGTSTSPVIVGAALDNLSPDPHTNYFDGKIDEVRIWDVARTSTEIDDNMDVELAGSEAGLKAYWKFDNNYSDSTTNGNTLAPNSTVFSTDVFGGSTEPGADESAARKSTMEDLDSSTTLQNDDELELSLNSEKTYVVDGVLFVHTSGVRTDMRIAFDSPGGSEIAIAYAGVDRGALTENGVSSDLISLPANELVPVVIHGTVVTGEEDGMFQLQWAQGFESSENLEVHAGSYLRAQEI